MTAWRFPAVERFCCWYATLDRDSWRGEGLFPAGNVWAANRLFRDGRGFGGRLCLLDAAVTAAVESFPPTLFVTASRDPIGLQYPGGTHASQLRFRGVHEGGALGMLQGR